MTQDVATTAVSKRAPLKFSLSHAQAMQLTTRVVPVIGDKGRVKLVPRPASEAGKPYRVLDGNQEAPVGFGFYVGKTKVTYEVVRRGPRGVRRFSLGNVTDMGLEEAYAEARRKLSILRETGENPHVHAAKVKAEQQSADRLKSITVLECMQAYLTDMEARLTRGQLKATSINAFKDSMARLARPEVDLAGRVVRTLRDADIEAGYEAMRKSAMVRSNRIPTAMKQLLARFDDWARLDTATLESIGITGKYVQRVKASGVAAAEHTFADAFRGVKFVVQRELKEARYGERAPSLAHNPFAVIYEKQLVRDARRLRKHYEQAAVRNPLNDATLPKVLKSILARRDEQGGHNAGAADYLMLTLLWGTRRSEAAQLRWFDRCSKGELQQQEASWVWLAESSTINPYTKRAGSQVFMSDTKSGESRFLPVTYFAERILRRRFDERLNDATAKRELAAAEVLLAKAQKGGASKAVIDGLKAGVDAATYQVARASYVFPARSTRSKSGHYSDSKSILANVRRDSGLADIREDIDQGLTTHDLRRTLGRFAALKFGESRIVSQMLHHHVRGGDDGMAEVSQRYTEQEWGRLRDAFGEVEEMMIASSPRVWNRLKGVDKPRLDEAHDEPVTIFVSRNQTIALGDE